MSLPEDDGMAHGHVHNSLMQVRKVAMVIPLSLEICGGGLGISSREEEVCPSSPKNERSMTWVIFLLPSVESCGGDHGISSREEEVCPSSPQMERNMTMVIFFLSPLESCGGGHGISSREDEVCPSYS